MHVYSCHDHNCNYLEETFWLVFTRIFTFLNSCICELHNYLNTNRIINYLLFYILFYFVLLNFFCFWFFGVFVLVTCFKQYNISLLYIFKVQLPKVMKNYFRLQKVDTVLKLSSLLLKKQKLDSLI